MTSRMAYSTTFTAKTPVSRMFATLSFVPSRSGLAEVDANMSIPSAMFDMVAMMSPEIQAAVEMGILTKRGNVYLMEAVYRKGLLTVNGAPLPIPLSGF